jgi:hypothetical protein
MNVRIENWSIVEDEDPYVAPEAKGKYLSGKIYGHPLHEDGKNITTSRLVKLDIDNDMAETLSGTEYILGNIDPDYLKWRQDNDV